MFFALCLIEKQNLKLIFCLNHFAQTEDLAKIFAQISRNKGEKNRNKVLKSLPFLKDNSKKKYLKNSKIIN
jgi:hypothetical protein